MVIECSICINFIDDDEFKPVTGTCGHTLCIKCCRAIADRKCPTCQREHSFRDEIVNFQLIELINTVKDEKAKQAAKKIAKEKEVNRNFCTCSECGLLIKKEQGRLCLPCCETQRISSNDKTPLDEQLAESLVFCGSCALEGVHKNHQTVLYNHFKLTQQTVIALGKVVKKCESVTTTGCREEFEKMKSVKTRLIKVLTNITLNVQNIEVTKYNELLKVCENAKNGYQEAIYHLERQMRETTKTLEDLEARLLSTLPNQATNVPRTERTTKPEVPVHKPLQAPLLVQQGAIDTREQGITNRIVPNEVSDGLDKLNWLTKIAEPITEMVKLLVSSIVNKRNFYVDIELDSPGIHCYQKKCSTRNIGSGLYRQKLCQSVKYEGKEGLYPSSDLLLNSPLFYSDGTCRNCKCEMECHKYRSYFLKYKIDPKQKKLTQFDETQYTFELDQFKNFIVEAILFRSLSDPAWQQHQDPFIAFLRFFSTTMIFSMSGRWFTSFTTFYNNILKIVEKRQKEMQQGNNSAKTQIEMEKMFKNLGGLEFTGPILQRLNLVK